MSFTLIAGTPILTNQGNISIELLRPGIHTIRNKKIVEITKTRNIDNYLVCIEENALGQNIPCQKTIMSPNHKIFYKGKMIEAKFFTGIIPTIYEINYNNELLYNVVMEQYDKMMVNNLICETLHPENGTAKLFAAFKTLDISDKLKLNKHVNIYNNEMRLIDNS